MPPIPKISKEMILDAGLSVIKIEGIENLNVRNIAKRLNCSTQPIMTHYKNVDMLKNELYELANKYHTKYFMEEKESDNILLSIGIRYIKFAYEEKNLFKFLFENKRFENLSILDVVDNENELNFIYEIIVNEANVSKKEAKEIFKYIFISAHGMASLIANSSMKFDKKYCVEILETSYIGIFNKIKGEKR